jgi:single-strand DNA-binding protein
MNINCWVGGGRLTRDAELTTTAKGTSMSKFRLAVNDRRTDETLFVNVLCFGKMAEALNPHLTKGRSVGVQGKIKVEEYEDKEKNKRQTVSVFADDVHLGTKKDTE